VVATSVAVAVVAVAVAATSGSPSARGETPALASPPERIYVLVVDGLRPFEVRESLAPELTALKEKSTWYEEPRAVFPAETLPNHAAMMTGVVPSRSGIVGNKYQRDDIGSAGGVYMQEPSMLRTDTLVTRLERACGSGVFTATTLSKLYLWQLFQGEQPTSPPAPGNQLEADFHWRPQPVIPVSDHAPDAATMEAFTPWARTTSTPQFAFVNLGDVDRAGHADEGGTNLTGGEPGEPSERRTDTFHQTAILDTDMLVGRFIDELENEEWWDETVLIVLSDHGMGWATHERWIDLQDWLVIPRKTGTGNYAANIDYVIVNNGAADSLYFRNQPQVDQDAIIDRIREHPGVERVLTDRQKPPTGPGLASEHRRSDYGLEDRRAGDVIALAKPEWSFNPGEASTNPVPGVHGHAVTQHGTLFVTGGWPGLATVGPGAASQRSVPGQQVWPVGDAPLRPELGPGPMSIAPTVAMLTGLGETAGGYDAEPLVEAFDTSVSGGGTAPFCSGIAVPEPPVAQTGPASAVGPDSATLTGEVNPRGQADVRYFFEYALDGSESWRATSAQALGAVNEEAHQVSVSVGALLAERTYRYRLVATSPAGTTRGTEQTFTTSARREAPADPGPADQPAHDPAPEGGTVSTTIVRSARAVGYRRPFALSGRVEATGACAPATWVEVRRRVRGQKRTVSVGEAPVTAAGTWRLELSQARSARYWATPSGALCGAKPAPPVDVLVRAQIALATRPVCGESGGVRGRVLPRHPGSRVLLQRRAPAGWQTIDRDRLDRHSRFELGTRSCGSGRYRVLWPQQLRANMRSERRLTL
jgi:ectonucleotide pyrophosphatase/phosphodiesterase family protein 5